MKTSKLLPPLLFTLCALVFSGCTTIEEGKAMNLLGQRMPLDSLTVRKPKRIALVNTLQPVLYISNAEGNFWSGKSLFVPAPELASATNLVDEIVIRQVKEVFGEVEVLRLTLDEAERTRDLDWVIYLEPNGVILPQITLAEFAQAVLVASARTMGGTHPSVAIIDSGTKRPPPPPGDRPSYTMGANPIYGVMISVQISWTVLDARTSVPLAALKAMSNLRTHIGKNKKEWAEWKPEEQAMLWKDLHAALPTIISRHLAEMGIGKSADTSKSGPAIFMPQ